MGTTHRRNRGLGSRGIWHFLYLQNMLTCESNHIRSYWEVLDTKISRRTIPKPEYTLESF